MNCNLTIFIEIVEKNSGKLAVWVHLCSRYQSIAQLTWGNNMWLAKQQQEGRENPCTGGKCQSYQNAVFCKMHPLVVFFFLLLLFLRNFILHINMSLCLVTQLFEEFEKNPSMLRWFYFSYCTFSIDLDFFRTDCNRMFDFTLQVLDLIIHSIKTFFPVFLHLMLD